MKCREKMYRRKNCTLFHYLSLGLLFSLISLSPIASIPTATSTSSQTLNTTVSQTTTVEQITDTGTGAIGLNTTTHNSLSDIVISEQNRTQESYDILNTTKHNDSVISQTSDTLQQIESDLNDKINGNIAVNQLNGLSADQINRPAIEAIVGNDITSDLSHTMAPEVRPLPVLADNTSNTDNTNHTVYDVNGDGNQTNQMIANPLLIKSENDSSVNSSRTEPILHVSSTESHRNKRSFLLSPLQSNLDEILNIRRQRRRAQRYKRNANYEDLLASILSQDDTGKYDNSDANDALNTIAMNYILNNINSYDSSDNNKYSDLEKIKEYYDYILPLISDTTDSDADDSVTEDLPIGYEGYSGSSIPVIPYSWPNRYQRIRRSYYNRYQNPLSVYTGLKRKRGFGSYGSRGEWGRIVGANSERSAYDDEAQEANKIYSLATLLAQDYSPEVAYGRRYKRSAKPYKRSVRSAKPALKNM